MTDIQGAMREQHPLDAERAAMPRSTDATLLIVDDEPLVIRGLARLVPGTLRHIEAQTLTIALKRIESSERLHGLIVDVGLPDGSGLDVLDSWCARFPGAPAVVMTGNSGNLPAANRAFARRCRFLAKPFGAEEFSMFTTDVLAVRWGVSGDIAPKFGAFIARHGLSPSQADLLARCNHGASHQRIADELGISLNTLKTRVQQLCRKLGSTSAEIAYKKMMCG